MSALWPEAVQMMYRKDSGIKSLADFKGKKVAVGPAAGGGVFYLPTILKEYNGMTFEDFDAQYLGYGDSVQALQNGLIDACYLSSGLPTSAVSQLYAGQVPVDMVELSDEEVTRISKAAPYFTAVTVPAGTYSKQDRPIQTVATKSSFVVDASVDSDLIYNMLDSLYIKHLDSVQTQHGAMKLVTLEEAVKGLTGAPLHPGAVKFYREHGIDVPDSLIPPEMK
jgi:TRAP transporter TAXI family solute receptor